MLRGEEFSMKITNRIAPESIKTKRAREKLGKQWERQDRQVTKAALKGSVEKIHQWIASHAGARVRLKGKEIRLFDENQNAAPLSQKIQRLAKTLRKVDNDHRG